MTIAARSELRLAVSIDHDGECGVAAFLNTGEFRGRGHAWLNAADLEDFSVAAKQLANSSSGEAVLSGGCLSADGTPDYTVRLVFRPYGSRGHILLAAELANGSRTGDSAPSRLFACLIVEPAALDRFAAQLVGIAAGARVEAVLEGESAA
jgi:hypothetical protein